MFSHNEIFAQYVTQYVLVKSSHFFFQMQNLWNSVLFDDLKPFRRTLALSEDFHQIEGVFVLSDGSSIKYVHVQ